MNIREIRRAKNITQKELAQAIGVDESVISRYEKGVINPPAGRLRQIADYLGVPPNALVEGVHYDIYEICKENEVVNQLPVDPDQILKDIAVSDIPEKTAFIYSNLLIRLSNAPDEKYWTRAGRNLLILILLYVAKAEGFMSLTIRKTGGHQTDDCNKFRTAAEVAEHIYIHDPDIIHENIGEAMCKSRKDEELLYAYYNTHFMSRHYREIAANLAVQTEILGYLKKWL